MTKMRNSSRILLAAAVCAAFGAGQAGGDDQCSCHAVEFGHVHKGSQVLADPPMMCAVFAKVIRKNADGIALSTSDPIEVKKNTDLGTYPTAEKFEVEFAVETKDIDTHVCQTGKKTQPHAKLIETTTPKVTVSGQTQPIVLTRDTTAVAWEAAAPWTGTWTVPNEPPGQALSGPYTFKFEGKIEDKYGDHPVKDKNGNVTGDESDDKEDVDLSDYGAHLTVVKVETVKIAYKDTKAKTEYTDTDDGELYVGLEKGGTKLDLSALSHPTTQAGKNLWPAGKPVWSLEKPQDAESLPNNPGDAFNYKATKFGMYKFTSECGNKVSVKALVSDFVLKVASVKNPANEKFDADNADSPRPVLYVWKEDASSEVNVEMRAPDGSPYSDISKYRYEVTGKTVTDHGKGGGGKGPFKVTLQPDDYPANARFTVQAWYDINGDGTWDSTSEPVRYIDVVILSLQLLQFGLDSSDPSKEITLRKTGGFWPDDTYQSGGDTDITDPIWKDSDPHDGNPEISDPVCYIRGAVPKFVAGKLRIQPGLSSSTAEVKLKVKATPQGDLGFASSLVFGPIDLSLTAETVVVPAMVASGGTVGDRVNSFTYRIQPWVSLDGGSSWCELDDSATPLVLVSYAEPKKDYCSGIRPKFSWDPLGRTAKRMADFACKHGKGGKDEQELAVKFRDAIFDKPGPGGGEENNPFCQLDKELKGQCLCLANLAATGLRLLGIDGVAQSAYCVGETSFDPDDHFRWGWEAVYDHVAQPFWWYAWKDNAYEGFFYIGDRDPLSSGQFPTSGWTVFPPRAAHVAEGKFLPLQIMAEISVAQLCWHGGWDNCNDFGWLEPTNTIPFVDLTKGTPCTTWTGVDAGTCPLEYKFTEGDPPKKTLSLGKGPAQSFQSGLPYDLPGEKGDGYIHIMIGQPDRTNRTVNIYIDPAGKQATVPK